MTTSSEAAEDAFEAFKAHHGLDDGWQVRFTADEFRAREMAQEYRASGHEVRVLPLTHEGEELDPETFEQFRSADYDPLKHVEDESCTSCLGGTHVLLTRERDDAEAGEELVYE